VGSDRALNGLAGQVVDQVSADYVLDDSGVLGSQYLNRAAFALPAAGELGNTSFNQFRGFSFWTLDTAISRIFDVVGQQRIELRVEAFNLLNTVQPLDPSFNFAAANFGRVTNVRDPRIFQFAVKYIF
jgi:hypothetical protein